MSPPLPPRYLATKLAEPLPPTDGGVLRTVGEAVAYMTALPEHREIKQAWQHACKLILSRAPVEAITRQLSLALFSWMPSSTWVTDALAPNNGMKTKTHF